MKHREELPDKFLERVSRIVPPKFRDASLASLAHPFPIAFRTNTLKISSVELIDLLSGQGYLTVGVPWYSDAFLLKSDSKQNLSKSESFLNGQLYIQNLSSMVPVLALSPKPGDSVLDLAAAPGSKTTQIAALLENSGAIVANDVSKDRFYRLKSVLAMQGVTNVKLSLRDGIQLWKEYPEYFDRVIVDAPCTMEGMFKSGNPKSYLGWSEKKVRILATKQQYLLRSAISSTKVGGTIIYSTCTLSPEENEGVIDWILKKEGDCIELERIQIEGLDLEEGIDYWNKQLNSEVKKCARIYPSATMEGFFIAKIRKLKPTV